MRARVSPWRISLIDACRFLAVPMLGLPGVADLVINPYRPGRVEPRVVRRRPKQYDRMTRPRAELKTQLRTGQQVKH